MKKIMQIKVIKGNRVSKQTSHSLKYLGNNLYRGNSLLRAGKTEFVIGANRWSQQIPASADRSSYVFMLDNRKTSEPQLMLFAKSDLQ